MHFYSTKKNAPEVDFKTAFFQSLAPDGGLYMPVSLPHISSEELKKVSTLQDAAFLVMRKWMDVADIADDVVKSLVEEAFSFPTPLVPVGDYSVLELFHGPTMAFKDIAAGVLARLFGYYLEQDKKEITILVATSGDTGGAIAQAFSGIGRVKVVVLYPLGKVSALQEEQLTRVEENVITIAVDGDFDACQAFVKKAFQDPDLQQYNLSSANSINIGRLIPQIIYYVWAYRQAKAEKIRFVVPSGNMGNVTAALFAQRMGVPIVSLVIATNENDVAVKYYETGVYQNKETFQTLSTAMDIGKPSNFERILALFQYNYDEFKKIISAIRVTDKETVSTIKKVYAQRQYLMDFHTAVGYCAAQKSEVSKVPTVIVSTASPLKFAKEMEKETGIAVDNAQVIASLRKKEKHVIRSENNYESIKKIIMGRL